MDVNEVRRIILERSEVDPQNDILTCQYQEKLFEIFKIDLTESMDFLDSCSAEELYWIS